LKTAKEPQVYWFDMEGERISVNCDDDFKFFMEESQVCKLHFQYLSKEMESSLLDENNRKRRCNEAYNEDLENSKRIRSILKRIDLSSESLISMDCSSDSEDETAEKDNHNYEQVPSTSAESNAHFTNDSPNVNIIDVEIIQPAASNDQQEPIIQEKSGATESNEMQTNAQEEQRQSNNDNNKNNESDNGDRRERKESDSNRIVISDSSDDEEDNGTTYNNRRHSDSNFASSSFSFADADGQRFESRASFDGSRNNYRYRNRFQEFNQQRASNVNDNINRIMRDAHETVARNIRQANNLSQNILSTFQSHFRPLFNATQQQYTRNYYR
jgi:hypothetical protein